MKDLEELKKEFPELYRELWGFECHAGWYDLLRDLSLQIQEHLKIAPHHAGGKFPIYADEVKEKWGTLRFYIGLGCDEVREMIAKAEKLSAKTCETCGKEGSLRSRNGYLCTRCESCWKEEMDAP